METYKTKDFEYISYKDFQQLLQTMEQICRHLKRCCLITDRMMDLHQDKTNIAAQDTDINGIIRSIFNLYKQQLKDRHIKPRLILAKVLPIIPVSTIQIHQVVQHVLLNAIQSMPNGGSLFVSTSLADQWRMVAIE